VLFRSEKNILTRGNYKKENKNVISIIADTSWTSYPERPG